MKIVYYLLIAFVFALIGWFANTAWHLPKEVNPIAEIKPRPLEKYSIENLAKTEFESSEITIDGNLFSFSVEVPPGSGQSKKVTGQINIPQGEGPFPIIIMLRGYVDQKTYTTGDGTKRVADYLVKNGFITVAPDFLGYGGSDPEAENVFESRFQTYTTALTLINSVGSITQWDNKNLFIWGHSNGGQLALTVLEITEADYPTVLWAPVSKPFPYSILYYTDESDDRGKLIRRELAKFEKDYDVEKYSLVNYLDRIRAPIELHQGTLDDAVPIDWSNSLVERLEELKVDISYIKHPGSDHNLQPSWSSAVQKSLTFFKKGVK